MASSEDYNVAPCPWCGGFAVTNRLTLAAQHAHRETVCDTCRQPIAVLRVVTWKVVRRYGVPGEPT